MSAPSNLWDYEKSFWLDGPEFYETHMDSGARMIFPGIGVLVGEEIAEGLKSAPRWSSVDFDDTGGVESGDTAVLTYRAIGQREGQDKYSAWCSSTYARKGDIWQLVAHHQTLVD